MSIHEYHLILVFLFTKLVNLEIFLNTGVVDWDASDLEELFMPTFAPFALNTCFGTVTDVCGGNGGI